MCGFGLLCERLTIENWLIQDVVPDDEEIESPVSLDHYPRDQTQNWSASEKHNLVKSWSERIMRRGPDGYTEESFVISEFTEVLMMGAVLHIRGPEPTLQPLSDEGGNKLLFNGEIFGGLEVKDGENDTKALLKSLSSCQSPSEIQSVMALIEGPWAFAFYYKAANVLYFGRDPIALSSSFVPNPRNADVFQWIEVDTNGIYSIHFPESTETAPAMMRLWPWDRTLMLPKRTSDLIVPPENAEKDKAHTENTWIDYSEKLYESLLNSIRLRVVNRPSYPGSVAILFSGGVDSTVIAGIAGTLLPPEEPLDLINVSFSLTGTDYDTSSDRKLALSAWKNLCTVQSERRWNFVEVNVLFDALQEWKPHVAEVMLPQDTLMDITISAALWFAARGEGTLHSYTPEGGAKVEGPYKAPAKILLVGHGADEQLGGYGRHITSWTKGGWERLQEELEKDIQRIWKRNLGRDDRVISDLGKEARHPFLDEHFVKFVASVPLFFVSDYRWERGIGDKKILRLVSEKMGLSISAKAPKKAIQFGTNIAKQFPKNRNTKGTDSFV